MAFDDVLAERVRGVLGDTPVAEKRMFGGLAFLSHGHMFVGINDDTLMVRTGPAHHASALRRKHVRPMDFTGRALKGYVYVDPPGLNRDSDLEYWVTLALGFVGSLPPK